MVGVDAYAAAVTSPERRRGRLDLPYGTTGPSLTWVGHATVAIELGDVKVLTDPALTRRVAHLRRHDVADVAAVGTPDVVLISHVHMDHLHLPSLRMFGSDIDLIVPTGAGNLLRRRGFRRVREIAAGRTVVVGRLRIEAVPAADSGRRGPHSRVFAQPVGYVLRAAEGSVYFVGDTDLYPGMAALAPVDVALLPIWGWGRTIGPGHLNPLRAVRATKLVQPGVVVPIHWGTYSPIGLHRAPPRWLREPLHTFESALDDAGAGHHLRPLDPGGTLLLSPMGIPTHVARERSRQSR